MKKAKNQIKFHILYTSSDGSITIYDLESTSKRMAEVIAIEGIQEGLVDDFGFPMVSFIVIDEVEYNNLPESFFV